MRRTLVIGGGPAGLVTARTLLQRHNDGDAFDVTLFESAERVGGMWRMRQDEDGEKCSPHMPTNLSRFTVAFSDLAWQSVDINPRKIASKESLPMFPKAYQVGLYLEEYARRYVPDGTIVLHRKVTSVERSGSIWSVSSIDTRSGELYKDEFDKLIIASGFFGEPKDKLVAPITLARQHSSRLRHVSSLTNAAGNIVVVGGSIGGSEAAATAAYQISDAKYAPGKGKPAWSESKVYHVLDRPFYCLPRYVSPNPYDVSVQNWALAPDFLPLDLVLYNASRRSPDAKQAAVGLPSGPASSQCESGHRFIRRMLGGDQRDFGNEDIVYRGMLPKQVPTHTGVSDTYLEFVRSGLIVPVQGRAGEIKDTSGVFSVEVAPNSVLNGLAEALPVKQDAQRNKVRYIENVTGIIEATGYCPCLDYLSDEVKQILNHDADCDRIPLELGIGSVFHPGIDNIAFVGFYEGPYWAVMEQQARLIARYWSDEREGLNDTSRFFDTGASDHMRAAIKRKDPLVPHFWMSDYMGFVLEMQRACSSDPAPVEGLVYPARFPNDDSKGQIIGESKQTEADLKTTLSQSAQRGRFVAAAAFRAMQGDWLLQRKIDSRNKSSPGGLFKGTACFHPREPTSAPYTAEYLYVEEGTFTMDHGFEFPASRRYVYRYKESTDTISTWFVEDDGASAERLFNSFELQERTGDAEKGWIAKSSHWCDPDQYNSLVEFRFRGVLLESFGTTYIVNGPNKDYTHESWYRRGI